MIQEIFYTDNRTYIKGERETEINTDRIPFTEAFKLATMVNVEIHFENLTKTDIIDFSKYIEETYDYKETTVQDTAITIIDRMNQIFSLW